MGGLLIDLAPLRRVPAFRRLWMGGALSSVGGSMTMYAIPLQIWRMTHSSLDVGLVGLAIAVPSVVVGVIAGIVADTVDRRRLLLAATVVQMGLSGLLALQAYQGWDRVWVLYAVVTFSAVVSSVSGPARRALMPVLLGSEDITSGAALQMFSMHGALVIGPAIAGLITSGVGLRACYVVDAVSFVFALYGTARLPDLSRARLDRGGWSALGDGLRFIGRHRVVLGSLLADTSACFLAMPVALFPALDATRFHGDPSTLGLMSTALAVGGVTGTILSGPTRGLRRQGLGMLVAGAVWGAALAGFGLAHDFPLTVACLVLAGAADSTAVVLRTSLVQRATPDHLRGRVSGAEMAVGAGMAQLGNTRAGVVASWTSPATSAVSGGIACVVAAGLIGLGLPALVRYRTGDVDQVAGATP
jgi:MFS family permease